jgi:hypothetical protein
MLDTLLKRFDTIVNAVTLVIVIIIAIVGGKLIMRALSLFTSKTEVQTFAWTHVEGAEETDQLVTGFLAIDMLWLEYPNDQGQKTWYSLAKILDKDVPAALKSQLYADGSTADNATDADRRDRAARRADANAAKKPMVYCAHSYEIVVGYPSLSELRASLVAAVVANGAEKAEMPAPELLALDVVNSRTNPPERTRECMLRNETSQRLRTKSDLQDVMKKDGVYELHQKQGQLAAASLLDAISGACEPDQPKGTASKSVATAPPAGGTSSTSGAPALSAPMSDAAAEAAVKATCWRRVLRDRWRPHADPNALTLESRAGASALAADSAGIGAVQVTISTLFGMDAAWRPWYWFDREGVYLQRDVTRIVYGSPLAPIATVERPDLLGEGVPRLVLHRPDELSRDRETSFATQTGAVWDHVAEENKENLATYVTGEINKSVARAEQSIRGRALMTAEALIRQRVFNWFDGRVAVEFGGDGAKENPLPLISEQSR